MSTINKISISFAVIGCMIAIVALGLGIDYEVNKPATNTVKISNDGIANSLVRWTSSTDVGSTDLTFNENILESKTNQLNFATEGEISTNGTLRATNNVFVQNFLPCGYGKYILTENSSTVNGTDATSVVSTGEGLLTFTSFAIGDTIQWELYGVAQTDVADTLILTVRMLSSSLEMSENLTVNVPDSGGARIINYKGTMTLRSLGSTATSSVTHLLTLVDGTTSEVVGNSIQGISIDTTLENTFDILAHWGVGGSGRIFRSTNLTLIVPYST